MIKTILNEKLGPFVNFQQRETLIIETKILN